MRPVQVFAAVALLCAGCFYGGRAWLYRGESDSHNVHGAA